MTQVGRFEWERAVHADPSVDRTRHHVLVTLATFANRDGRVTVGATRLELASRLAASTVREHLTGAQAAGLLERVARGHYVAGGRAVASSYLLTLPVADEPSGDNPTAGAPAVGDPGPTASTAAVETACGTAVGDEPTASNTAPNRQHGGTQPPAGQRLPWGSMGYTSTRPRAGAHARAGHAPARATPPASLKPPLPAPCGHCDAKPGDPPGARLVVDAEGRPVRNCPNCHPSALKEATPK